MRSGSGLYALTKRYRRQVSAGSFTRSVANKLSGRKQASKLVYFSMWNVETQYYSLKHGTVYRKVNLK